jgi:hypothetical protein
VQTRKIVYKVVMITVFFANPSSRLRQIVLSSTAGLKIVLPGTVKKCITSCYNLNKEALHHHFTVEKIESSVYQHNFHQKLMACHHIDQHGGPTWIFANLMNVVV